MTQFCFVLVSLLLSSVPSFQAVHINQLISTLLPPKTPTSEAGSGSSMLSLPAPTRINCYLFAVQTSVRCSDDNLALAYSRHLQSGKTAATKQQPFTMEGDSSTRGL